MATAIFKNLVCFLQGFMPSMMNPNEAIKLIMNALISKLEKPAARSAKETKTILNMILCDCFNQV